MNFSLEELEKTAEINNALIEQGRDQPLVVTHQDNDLAMKNNEIYGYVSRYYVEDDIFKFDLDVAEGKEKYIKRGDKRMLSMARFPKTKEIYHVAFTGRQAIPIANMKFGTFEEFSDSNDLEIIEQFEYEGLLEKEEGMNEEVTKALETLKSMVDALGSKKTENTQEFMDELNKLQSQVESFKANEEENVSLKAKLVSLEAEKAEAEKKATEAIKQQKMAEITTKLEKYSAEGKILPTQLEKAKEIMDKVPELFEAFLELNKVVDFSEDFKVDEFKAVDSDDKVELSEEEKKMIKVESTR